VIQDALRRQKSGEEINSAELFDLWAGDHDGYAYTEEFQFKHCPMCGRELNGEI